ncbi:MAG: hypothetical protein J6Z12_07650 [Paludibacteraceae bacterium]|nr:hypothetical protein [Paludibacteraceae bacterium]
MSLLALVFWLILFFVLFSLVSVVGMVRRLLGLRPSQRRRQEQQAREEAGTARDYVKRKIDKSRAQDVDYEEVKEV